MIKFLYLFFLALQIYSQSSNIFKIAINNDRDEIYDILNIVYQINNTGNYSLNNLIISTNIKDVNNNIIHSLSKMTPSNYLFTFPFNITNLKLKENDFYQVEGILNSIIDNIESRSFYTFKKIEKINRKVKLDEYGRMYLNNELFFPFGIYTDYTYEQYMYYINQTHLNFIMPYKQIKNNSLNTLQKNQNGTIKVIYNVKSMYNWNQNADNSKGCIDEQEEENYRNFLKTLNNFKEHPLLIGWYINDEFPPCRNNYTRNKTLTFHQLDPDHPTLSVLDKPDKIHPFMNSTDIMGFDVYPVGQTKSSKIREVYDKLSNQYNILMKAKPMWAVIQIFDWGAYRKNKGYSSYTIQPPTLQEMRSMAWQGLASGAKGILLYAFHQMYIVNDTTPFEPRWKDVIEFTNEIWKYKDIILSIEKVDKIDYIKNDNVAFKQWKMNNSNYIAVINLERNNETFKVNLSNNYEINKEFGNGYYEKIDNEIIFYLEPIDVILVKYISSSENKNKSDDISDNTSDKNSDNNKDNNSDNNGDNNSDNIKENNSNNNGKTKLIIIIVCSVAGAIILVVSIILIRRKMISRRNDNYKQILTKN